MNVDWDEAAPTPTHMALARLVEAGKVEFQTKVREDFTITTQAFYRLKVPTSAFKFKTLLRHYAKQALTPRSLNVKLGPRRKGHKGRAVWLA